MNPFFKEGILIMASLEGLDFSIEAGNDDFEPITPGDYVALIVASEKKETKAKTGYYLEFTFQIVEGEFKERRLWDRLNLWNANKTAVKIANQRLAEIRKATGILNPSSSEELHDKPLLLKVVTRTRSDTGELTNEIKKVSSVASVPVESKPETTNASPWND